MSKSRIYRKVSDKRRTLVGNKIVDHSDVVGDWVRLILDNWRYAKIIFWKDIPYLIAHTRRGLQLVQSQACKNKVSENDM